MKRIVVVTSALGILMSGAVAFSAHVSAARPNVPAMSIQLTTPTRPVAVGMHGKIPINVRIQGMTLAPSSVGKAAMAGMGHYHVYVDCIPADAYVKADISRCYAQAEVSNAAVFNLAKSMVRVTRGEHLLIVALANNNHVLYNTPASAVPFTVR